MLTRRRCCCPTCDPCSIPTHDLTATEDLGTESTTFLLVYDAEHAVWSATLPGTAFLSYTLSCELGLVTLQVQDEFGASVGSVLLDYTCSPFHFHYQILTGITELFIDE